jgi:hypothetical protein
MTLKVFVELFVGDLLSKLDDHLSSNEFHDLVYPKRPFGALHSLQRDDLVHQVPIFHHFNLNTIRRGLNLHLWLL